MPLRLWPFYRLKALVAAVLIVAVSFGLAGAVDAFAGLKAGPNEYSVGAWETRHFAGKWLYLIGAKFRDKPSIEQENATLREFFALARDIDELEAALSDSETRGQGRDAAKESALDAKRSRRAELQAETERILEGRVTQVLDEQGITRSAGLGRVVWPPVAFDFTDAPRMLAQSPRDRIELIEQTPLREGLSLPEIERIETETGKKNDTAALAFPLGGYGAYPTLVDFGDDYERSVRVVTHEWMHNYLFFRPLGIRYNANNALRTINETVADLVGAEVAQEVVRRWPIEPPKPAPATPPAPASPEVQPEQPQQPERVNAIAELRKLRGEVDALLAQGKVEEAEALMEQRRQDLAARGFRIRKINQAYFAFLNLYAGAAGNQVATNPLGPKVDEVRKRTVTLKDFVDVIGNVTSVRELDEAIARLSRGSGS
jgi:hypothetical protein